MRLSGKRLSFIALGVAAIVLTCAPGRADFAEGLQAFDGGEYEAAAEAWRPLAEACDPYAQVALAGLYRHGLGRPRDAGQARHWYGLAAAAGLAIAQVNLGEIFAEGIDVPRDPAEAAYWFGIAARQGSDWAKERLEVVADGLSAEERDALKGRIAAFRPVTRERCG